MSDRVTADALAKRIGKKGESGIEVAEAMDSGKGAILDETIGDLVPGVSSLFNKHRRVVLVTNEHVYLLAGTIKKPGSPLGTYKLGRDVLRMDGDRLVFPDDMSVRVTRYQGQRLLQAAGGSFSREFGRRVLRNAGNPNESIEGFAWGTNPVATKRGVVDRASGTLLMGVSDKMEHEKRFVLVTDKACYVARDGPPNVAGTIVGSYPLGIEVMVVDGTTVAFPDDQAVTVRNEGEAERLAKAIGGA